MRLLKTSIEFLWWGGGMQSHFHRNSIDRATDQIIIILYPALEQLCTVKPAAVKVYDIFAINIILVKAF